MKDGFIKVASASPKIKVADCAYNSQQIIDIMKKANDEKVKLLVTPELGITGCTCGDLFYQSTLTSNALAALVDIANASEDTLTFVGLPMIYDGCLVNAAAAVQNGKIVGISIKAEKDKIFCSPKVDTEYISVQDTLVPFGKEISFVSDYCDELSVAPFIGKLTLSAPTTNVIVNLNSDNDYCNSANKRLNYYSVISSEKHCGIVMATPSIEESTTDLVYTSQNAIIENGEILACNRFSNDLLISELDIDKLSSERKKHNIFTNIDTSISFHTSVEQCNLTRPISSTPFTSQNEEILKAECDEMITLQAFGLKKRVEHSRAKKLVLGISGGLDSTLALLVCVKTMQMLNRPNSDILTVTMPCFGTTSRTKNNSHLLCEKLGTTFQEINIADTVKKHFEDIGHDINVQDTTFENSQARMRTMILMDLSNRFDGMVVGTGDLSESALGWATYNGDHMSMYNVNASIPKTVIRNIVRNEAQKSDDKDYASILIDILNTPVSPELTAPTDDSIAQKTEDIIGPYELHDFFIFNALVYGFSPKKIYRMACHAFKTVYSEEVILNCMKIFYRRFFTQQFKRSCSADGPKVTKVSLSPRCGFKMPSDAVSSLWLNELETL